jgi:hypothetical protein
MGTLKPDGNRFQFSREMAEERPKGKQGAFSELINQERDSE